MLNLGMLAKYRKFLVAIVGFLTGVLASGILPDKYSTLAHTIVSGLTALGVVFVPNDDYPVDDGDTVA